MKMINSASPTVYYSINAVNKWGMTWLHYAVKHENLDLVRVLIKTKANVNVHDLDFERPLHLASYLGNTDIVRCLLENGARDNINIHGYTAFRYAFEIGHYSICNDIYKTMIEKNYHKVEAPNFIVDDLYYDPVDKPNFEEMIVKVAGVCDAELTPMG